MELQKTNYKNDELNVEINCYVGKKNEIWFRGKEIASTLKYKNTQKAIRDHVHEDDKKLMAKIRGERNVPPLKKPRRWHN